MERPFRRHIEIFMLGLVSNVVICNPDITAKDACGAKGVCRCAIFSEEAIINCTGRNLTQLPSHLPVETTILYLTDNYIQRLEDGAFTKVTSLRILKISSNKLGELTKHSFDHLEKLESLNLTQNIIWRIEVGSFRMLKSLTWLSLSDNLIAKLTAGTFDNLSKLDALYLHSNRIREVDERVFNDLSRLQILDLERNAIPSLPSATLLALKQLTAIYLGDNQLDILPRQLFNSGENIHTLQLLGNRLHTIHRQDFGNIRKLEDVQISYNLISSLPNDLFMNMVLSYVLDLSNNRLTSLPEKLFDTNNETHQLEILFLHRNGLDHLPHNVFRGLRKLKYLCLFYNNIQVLADDTFAGIGVKKIYLFGNNLSYLSNASFTDSNIAEIFLDCEHVRELQLNLKIKCVTPQFVPELTMEVQFHRLMKREGFRCYRKLTAHYPRHLSFVCSPCPRGMFGYAGQCFPCFRGGFYQDEMGISAQHDKEVCKRCPDGTYVRKGRGKSIVDCAVCPDGTNKQSPAGFRGCFCQQNYARTDSFGPCSVCFEKGINCTGKDYKSLQPGFYWRWDFPGGNLTEYNMFLENLNTESWLFDSYTKYEGEIPRAFQCPRRESCHSDQSNANAKCSEGYTGWLCTKCEKKFYPVMNYCLACPNKEWLFIEISLTLCSCVVISVSLFCYYKREQRQNNNSRSIIDVLISRGKIALGFYQVVGEFFTSLHEVNWTNSLTFIGNLISFIELNILRLFIRPHCFHEDFKINPKTEFFIGLAIPISVLSVSPVLYCVFVSCYKCKLGYGTAYQPIHREKLKSKFLTIVIIMLFVTYPPICTIIFQLYPKACEKFCLDMNNHTCYVLLRSDYDIECKDLKVYHIFAYIATAAYVIAYPVFLLVLLRKHSQSFYLKTSQSNYLPINEHPEDEIQTLVNDSVFDAPHPVWMDFLCENYKSQYWYWEIVELTRKVTQTVLITLLGWEDKMTVLITIGISVLFLTLHARCLPMKSTFEQRLQLFSLVAILINVLVAAMDVPDEYGNAMSVALIVLNVVVIVIIAAEVVFGLFIRLKHMKIHNIIIKSGTGLKNIILIVFKRRG